MGIRKYGADPYAKTTVEHHTILREEIETFWYLIRLCNNHLGTTEL